MKSSLLQSFCLGLVALLASPLLASPPTGTGSTLSSESLDGRTCSAFLTDRFGIEFSASTTEHFLLVHPSDPDWAAETGEVLERAYTQFYRSFNEAGFTLQPVSSRLTWFCFTDHGQFNRYALEADSMDMSWLDGYYSSRTNRVTVVRSAGASIRPAMASATPSQANWDRVSLRQKTDLYPSAGSPAGDSSAQVDPDLPKTAHEAIHQLAFNSGLQKRGVMYPVWASEGLATQFEGVTPEGLQRNRQARAHRLLRAQSQGQLIPFEVFITLTTVAGQPEAAKNEYAQAWGFFAFLMQKHPAELRVYLANLAKLDPGRRDQSVMRREFTAAFGPSGPLEASWRQFLRDLATPALSMNSPQDD